MALKSFYSKKLLKIPKPPSVIRLSYSSLLTHVSQFRYFYFLILFKPYPSRKLLVKCRTRSTASDFPFYEIFVSQKVPSLKISDDVIASDLLFRPLNQKSWLRLCMGGGGRHFGPCPYQVTVCALQVRVNFYSSTRGPANFCTKTGHHKLFFMKHNDR